MVQRPRPTVPPALPPDGWLLCSLLTRSLLGRGRQACGMPLWHGHQWGQGAGCAGRKLQRNAARPSRQQSEDHGALGLAGPPLWRGGLCGSLMWPRHRSDAPPPPHPKSHIGSPSQGPLLTGPLHPPPLPTQVHLCLHTTPCPAAAVFPEYVCHLTHGRAVTWFWIQGNMEQRPRSQADTPHVV